VHLWQPCQVYSRLQTTDEIVRLLRMAEEVIPRSNDEVQRGEEQIVLPCGLTMTRLIVPTIYPVKPPPTETELETVVVKDVWNSVSVVVDCDCGDTDDGDVSQLVELDMSGECNHSSWLQIAVFARGTVDTFAVEAVQTTRDDTSVVAAVVGVVWMVVQRKKKRMDGREDTIEIDDGSSSSLLP